MEEDMWIDDLKALLDNPDLRKVQLIHLPLNSSDVVLMEVPQELRPILQAGAVYRQWAENAERKAGAGYQAQAIFYRATIEALRLNFHACLLEYCGKNGCCPRTFSVLASVGYEIREGWKIVAIPGAVRH